MKRIITLTLAALTLTGGVALADRHRGGDHRNNDRHEQRQDNRHNRQDNRWERRDYGRHDRVQNNRWERNRNVRVTRTRPTFRNNTFYFAGGYHRAYRAPVIRHRYYNYYQRPTLIVENYDAVPGYIWVAGAWSWNGYEWIWANGHYEVDVNYNGYYDGY